ncbi:hypothetical protein BT96DRAFT_925927 [Gymnopus androsaceus JB14]|uniref:Uncharacterized protein n=1 Tax=Gymnopus androsaceus JB14 TaxID=1447944 RepID=A0A6A4GXC4_9AGAR|nr:hypothetical protein BT96DRAFT_925927 [Gymnopus androsaceus JB14]
MDYSVPWYLQRRRAIFIGNLGQFERLCATSQKEKIAACWLSFGAFVLINARRFASSLAEILFILFFQRGFQSFSVAYRALGVISNSI